LALAVGITGVTPVVYASNWSANCDRQVQACQTVEQWH
jgi:hypothetical protein